VIAIIVVHGHVVDSEHVRHASVTGSPTHHGGVGVERQWVIYETVSDVVDTKHGKRYERGESTEHQTHQIGRIGIGHERTKHDGHGAFEHARLFQVVQAPFQGVRPDIDVFQEYDVAGAAQLVRRARRVLD